ncbi:hypothetical protein SISNIDRAFT_455662 [Sistotremastrum niveocremeum HHB9708]|uniref:CENP-C homolog n=1 Tax=Sistotremastrum niveocremeum HHB9708 TaxID=1314777 RepID=A0A164TLB7_9AGAM|nr:hypothetical protein SISNIDRAFT_455662 [Sistotremastrum niveocremeum HHB9708]
MSQRNSSVGPSNTRRGPQRNHLPFRADDLNHGKKTGKAVKEVQRDSDDLEPFDQVMSQADYATPPKKATNGRNKGKGRDPTPIVEEEDEEEGDGTVSMELDDEEDEEGTPTQYFKNTRRPSGPNSALGVGSAGNRLPRQADVDFDSVPNPSPRPRRVSTPAPRSFIAGDELDDEEVLTPQDALGDAGLAPLGEEDQNESANQDHDMSYSNLDSVYETLPPSARKSSRPSEASENIAMDSEEEAEPEPIVARPRLARTPVPERRQEEPDSVMEEAPPSSPPESHSAQRSRTPNQDDYPPDDNPPEAHEHQDEPEEDAVPPSSDQENEEPVKKVVSKEKKKKQPEPRAKKQAAAKRPRKALQNLSPEPEETEGLRRGKRLRYAPLEYWRCEKVVYGRRESGRHVVPIIKEIVRLPKEEPAPISNKPRSKRGPSSRRSQSVTKGHDDDEREVIHIPAEVPEAGWDEKTEPYGVVLDYTSGVEVKRRVAFTSAMIKPEKAAGAEYSYQKIFGDGNFMAAGQLEIPPKSAKPAKSTRDNTYIFYLIEGAVQFKVHRTSYILAPGGTFIVPRGNMYYIENIGQRDAKLFFAQARKIPAEEDDAILSQTQSQNQ